jgi:hypothetical protein
MSIIVLISNTFVEKINSIIRPFWWAGVQVMTEAPP